MSDKPLLVNEIFASIDGEGKRAGELATFIRLTGCNLRCSYCDTAYAFKEGKPMTVQEIVDKVTQKRVTLTGGEPLTQDVKPLLKALKGHEVNIETNGSIDIAPYFDFDNVFFTVDYKSGSSGMNKKMLMSNFKKLRSKDVLKFVIGSFEDLEEAKLFYLNHFADLQDYKIYVSPVFGQIEPKDIVEFMKKNNLGQWRIQLQLHKFIWNPKKRGV